jgi:hypothetical protein
LGVVMAGLVSVVGACLQAMGCGWVFNRLQAGSYS